MSQPNQDGSADEPSALNAREWQIVASGLTYALRETLLVLGPQIQTHAIAELESLRDHLIREVQNSPLTGVPEPGETAAIEKIVQCIRLVFDGSPARPDGRIDRP